MAIHFSFYERLLHHTTFISPLASLQLSSILSSWRQIDAADREIDCLVYELYGLTDEEIKLVEDS